MCVCNLAPCSTILWSDGINFPHVICQLPHVNKLMEMAFYYTGTWSWVNPLHMYSGFLLPRVIVKVENVWNIRSQLWSPSKENRSPVPAFILRISEINLLTYLGRGTCSEGHGRFVRLISFELIGSSVRLINLNCVISIYENSFRRVQLLCIPLTWGEIAIQLRI